MKLESIIVCKDYGDFLEHTLPENMQHFDRMVVVTHPSDNRTKTLCNRYGIDCIETEEFHRDGDLFNKGRVINQGLSHLRHDGWLLHMDADVLLPHGFRNLLENAQLDKRNIYGADRLNTTSYDHWQNNKHHTKPAHQWRYMVTAPKEFNLGARLLHQEYGYCPIGYFQLWHSSAGKKYPIVNGSAEHGDVLFAIQWKRENRVLLPEIIVYHLESDGDAPMGANWKGRKTPEFKPTGLVKTSSSVNQELASYLPNAPTVYVPANTQPKNTGWAIAAAFAAFFSVTIGLYFVLRGY